MRGINPFQLDEKTSEIVDSSEFFGFWIRLDNSFLLQILSRNTRIATFGEKFKLATLSNYPAI